MKPTTENEKILRLMGFTPDSDRMRDMDGWWGLDGGGWSFRIDAIRNFKHLVKRLMLTEYERGYEKARGDYDEN